MVTRSENDWLTRVEGDVPMGRLIRKNYWMPFARSEALVRGGAPQRVRLTGVDMVAFRSEDGTLGLMDEHCPHRRASLALARVEGCALRPCGDGRRTLQRADNHGAARRHRRAGEHGADR